MGSKREVSTKIFEEGLEVKTILYKVQVPGTRPSEDDVLNSEGKALAAVASQVLEMPGCRMFVVGTFKGINGAIPRTHEDCQWQDHIDSWSRTWSAPGHHKT